MNYWDSKPIREELFGLERLEEHAVSLAEAQATSGTRGDNRSLNERLADNRTALHEAYDSLSSAAAAGAAIFPAGQWLLDNYYLVKEQLIQIQHDLPAGYYRQLPKLVNGPFRGLPRVFGITWAYVAHTDSHFNPETLVSFLNAYQRITPLTIGEVWAVAITLRIVLIENLRRLGGQITKNRQLRFKADELVDRLTGAGGRQAEAVPALLGPYQDDVPDVLLVRLVQRLRDHDPKTTPAFRWAGERAAARGTTLDELVQQDHLAQSSANMTVRNIITSLKLVSEYVWPDFVEAVSKVDELLRSYPPFVLMDFPTRNVYRNAVEKLARGSRHDELAIARLALAAAEYPVVGNPHASDPGYWLIGAGRPLFHRQTGYRAPLAELLLRLDTRSGLSGYLLSSAAITCALLALPLGILAAYGIPGWQLLLLALLGALPFSSAALAIVNRIMIVEARTQVLPGLEFKHGVPSAYRTLLAIPALLQDDTVVAELLEQLEVHYLSNPEDEIFFALLSDFPDAATEATPTDAQLLRQAQVGIRELNERYGQPGRFLLLHRKRTPNNTDSVWRGWERKRGKLHELNRLLRGAADTNFLFPGSPALPNGVQFVITLDADTRLPPGAARRLIGKLAHPLNRPLLDPLTGRVKAGHAIIQPRVSPEMPELQQDSPYHRILAGDGGLDPYASAVSDVYQDLFDEGSYAGKGIYDLDAFEAALAGRVPDDTLLSHDLFEGIFARAGLASDIEVIESFPNRYTAARARQHRWVRGDWQLLPWLLETRRPEGRSDAWNALPPLGRWKISDNLRRSLIEPLTFMALLAGWLLQPVTAVLWTVALLLILAVTPFLPVLTSLLPGMPGVPAGIHLRNVLAGINRAQQQTGLQLALLADRTWFIIDAIARTLRRTFITRRNMLEWVTAAQVESRLVPLAAHYRLMSGSLLLGVAAGALVWLVNPRMLPLALPFVLLWLLAPFIAWFVSRAPRAPQMNLDSEQRARLQLIAHRTWNFFATFVTADENHLPPDNYQETPWPVVAHRTSPTNIGMYLLAVVSAREFGWISAEEAVLRLEQTLQTLGRLDCYRGHFYNWYDTRSLATLEPAYVSTVDSGNLAGHLLAVAGACTRWAGDASALSARQLQLAETTRELSAGMDFSFLYKPERRLLSIGLQVASGELDESSYDLLASEANLASFIAIAHGYVPAEHWFRLGRAVTAVAGQAVLVSWSGSMFEYLMPSIVLRLNPDSLLAHTNRVVVSTQQRYGRQRNVPWGVSESAFNARDLEMTYQYSPFGLPQLGLKRGLARDTVISPHSTGLAAMVDPLAALSNFDRLDRLGAFTQHGYYEALDFTPSRVPEGKDFALVKAFMAHHQGMVLAGLTNVLLDGVLQRDFHSEARVQAVELLLQERPPHEFIELPQSMHPRLHAETSAHGVTPDRTLSGTGAAAMATHLLSNGSYSVLITAAGSGYSRWKELDVSRWREDPVRDNHGPAIYLQDPEADQVWCAGNYPLQQHADDYQVTFSEDRARIMRRDPGMITTLDICVSPEDDAEVRRVTLTNTGTEDREIIVTSFTELALAGNAEDRAHPAFAKMFVQTSFSEERQVLFASRRLRDPEAPEVHAAHFAVPDAEVLAPVEFETDRLKFLGRDRQADTAWALTPGQKLSGSSGTVLDPVFALRYRLRIPAGSSARIAFWTALSSSAAELDVLVDKYRDQDSFERTTTLAWTQAQVRLRHQGISTDEAHAFQRLAGHILYPSSALRAAPALIRYGVGPQSHLWPLGVSGDLPIVLARIDDPTNMQLVRELLQAHGYWRQKGLHTDLVILNEQASSYARDLQLTLEALARAAEGRAQMEEHDHQGAIFILQADQLQVAERLQLQSVARVLLLARRGSLAEQLGIADELQINADEPQTGSTKSAETGGMSWPVAASPRIEARQQVLRSTLKFFNGSGGFDPDTNEYVILTSHEQPTPAPWINVIANAGFGFQVSASGSGYTWSGNSKENQLTPWSNDPVTDPPGEAFYLRDEDTGVFWTPTPEPAGGVGIVRHGFGFTNISSEMHGISCELLQFVPATDPVKISRLKLRNNGTEPRRISLTAYAEWVLGPDRSKTAAFLRTDFDADSGALMARNPWSAHGEPAVAFLQLRGEQLQWTCDRLEFLGPRGNLARPAALCTPEALQGRSGASLDPCAAQRVTLEIPAGGSADVTCFLGQSATSEAARELLGHYGTADLDAVLHEATAQWHEVLQTVQVSTPDAALDVMMNGWLTYQTLACRIFARSAFYQASGAFGFRDQLQDGMSLVLSRPDLVRSHLLHAASRQFTEGDVQHWWLPDTGQGIRTRISDDRVWLGYTAVQYVRSTGDAAVLDEQVPFLSAPALAPGELDHFGIPGVTQATASLFEHCALALDDSLTVGAHGLPLIGTGDWNDGMNRVGMKGKGESVWLGWFLYLTLGQFIPLAESRGEADRVQRWTRFRQDLRASIEANAWDGEWYLRAFFDDGTPLGSHGNAECRIDSIAQSWAVLSGAAPPERAEAAMAALQLNLIRDDEKLALLFTPPFEHSLPDPGYLKAYPPGLRENGGQYTHAATWTVMALAKLGLGDDAGRLLQLLNPVNHALDEAAVDRYRVEPYVVAADIYSVAPNAGRGGWTWYTGSAAWLQRAALESVLGFTVQGDLLLLDPCVPRSWPGYSVTYRRHGTTYNVTVRNPDSVNSGVREVQHDGRIITDFAAGIPLQRDGAEHTLLVTLG